MDSNETSLKTYIMQKLSSIKKAYNDIHQLTIGVEHEFFLADKNELPCSHEQSQSFFELLAKEMGWHIQEATKCELGNIITRVSKNNSNGRFTAIKYDHHPHLLEVAFEYHSNLHDLFEHVAHIFDVLNTTAERLGLTVLHQPFTHVSAVDPRVISPLKAFEDLRHYRSILLMNRYGSIDHEAANYAATIAATQTHIGGIEWWNQSDLMNELYKLETDILALSYYGLSNNPDKLHEMIVKRWSGYHKVFAGQPLVGFPDITEWSLDSWIRALIQSPLAGTTKDIWAGSNLAVSNNVFGSDLTAFFKTVRDLQIIRPRFFGTLEFRNDPAQPTPERVVASAALRLASCVGVLLGFRSDSLFSNARTKWWDAVLTGSCEFNREHLNRAACWLEQRGLSEEKYLEPLFNAKKTSDAA